ncbi:ankyrin repeat-containing protein [Xylariomycetidae sp. FL0641]|nr:ankyrin repeat-containing protein [Xylariomycetidae sp. FL0641]
MEHLTVSPTDRQQRLAQLGETWGVSIGQAPPSPLPRPEQPLSFRSENDELIADDLLKRQRVSESEHVHSKGALSRAFTTKKKNTWEYREIYNALVAHVNAQGSPGVAEVLIARLSLAGGNLNLAQQKSNRSSLLGRRKSSDMGERSQILQIAVRNRHFDMVQVLLPYADALSLDTALPIALRNADDETTALLVSRGASVCQTTDGQDVFRGICAGGGRPDIVAHILASEGRPSEAWLSQCMVEAAAAGCADTVMHLSQSTADANYEGAAALKTAVKLGRKDIALALVTGQRPPQQPGLNQAFEQLMTQQNLNPNEKMDITETLLCAGADGDAVSLALIQASAAYFLEMVSLLVEFGASIEYEDAIALRKAVSKGKVDLVKIMLSGKSNLSAAHASECVGLLPKKMRFEDRYAFLDLLLRRGAAGVTLDEALIDAVEAGDVDAVKLLVTDTFPGGKIVGDKNLKRGPRSMVFEHHETASTDHKGALALQIAVKKGDVGITRHLFSKPPTPVAMAQVFPSTRNLPPRERYQITELFLANGLSGPPVNSALENAVDAEPPNRDEKLIALFLRYNADVNFNEGHSITAAIAQKDIQLLSSLLKSKPTLQVLAKAVPKAMACPDRSARQQMMTMLIGANASQGGFEVSAAVDTVITADRLDKALLELLLKQGQANVNINDGIAVEHAVLKPDIEVLEMVLALGRPSTESLERGLKSLGGVPSSPAKAEKLARLLARTQPPDVLADLLISEVGFLLATPRGSRNFATLRALLGHGADAGAHNCEALRRAVRAADLHLAETLLGAEGAPAPAALAFALPDALRLPDPMDRLTLAQRLLGAGVPPGEASRALAFAVRTYPDDLPLLAALAAPADPADPAPLDAAVQLDRQDLVDLLLRQTAFPAPVLNRTFARAATRRRSRSASCASLLGAGAGGAVVSDALLAAAADGDTAFGALLVQNGGRPDHKDGQAIVAACQAGNADVLRMLLGSAPEARVSLPSLQRGFQAATQVGDLARRADIFALLLQAGVEGDVVDAQLVGAVRYGDDAMPLVKLLLVYGASPDYNDGEAVEKATRSAGLGNLEMLLGVVDVGGRQKRPSSHTLVRALDACWTLHRDTRFKILEWIFHGRPVPSAVHAALHRAVNEEEPEGRLIQLLVNNRGSPVANGCQTLIDATRMLPAAAFEQLLEARVTAEDASLAFSQVFTAGDVSSWLSERGLAIAKCLLGKGASGDSVGDALVALLGRYAEFPDPITDEFVSVLLKYGADINHNDGEVLQMAAAQGNPELLSRLLKEKPSTESVTRAFPLIFDAGASSEDDVHQLITLFTEHGDGQSHLDPLFAYSGSEPVMTRALSQFPRSTKIVQALLDAGFYHDQMTVCEVLEGVEPEQVSLLMWALLQPQKKVSSGVIKLLINRGAKVDFETRVSRVTPLMVAIRAGRHDVVEALLDKGAEVDVTDAMGNSPLSLTSALGGDLATTMMGNLLKAGAPINDGSLHNAARELNLQAMQVLVEYGHDPDFPSPLHGGRSALGELCLHAADTGPFTAMKEKTMEKAINFLVKSGTDITLQSDGKSNLLLALESADPLPTTKVLLKADMWRYVNKAFNQYSDGAFTYSPTAYVKRVLPATAHTEALLALLKANRGTDVYYANAGPQPADAAGLPSILQLEEQERRARELRLAQQDEDHAQALRRERELAAAQASRATSRAELDATHRRAAHAAELAALQERGRVEAGLRQADLAHARAVGEAEDRQQARRLAWERDLGSERAGHAAQLSAIRRREREEVNRLEAVADGRARGRIADQRKLVDSQVALAAELARGGANAPGAAAAAAAGRRQIGFVSGELSPD